MKQNLVLSSPVGSQPSAEDMEVVEEDEDEMEEQRVREDADEDTQEEDEVGVTGLCVCWRNTKECVSVHKWLCVCVCVSMCVCVCVYHYLCNM